MLLIIIIVAFILTIVIIECSTFFRCATSIKKEKIDNIYLEDDNNDNDNDDDKVNFLQKCTGKDFKPMEFSETTTLNLDNNSIVFFKDYDIFIDDKYKLNKMVVYPIDKHSDIKIINYDGDIITIYVH